MSVDAKATKKSIFEELIKTRLRLHECQQAYNSEFNKRAAAEAVIGARNSTIKSYILAKKEIEYWIEQHAINMRTIHLLSKKINKYEDLYGKIKP